jgi:hypothetical protein
MKTLQDCLAGRPLRLSSHLLIASLLLASVVQAQPELQRCAALADNAERLQCYDGLAAALRSAAEAETTAPSAVQATPASDLAASPEPPARRGISTALALFGFESRPEEQRQITEVLDRVEAAVSSAVHNPFSGWTLTLANGQVWKQLGSDRFDIKPGDTAVITRGSLNSFLLQRGGEGRRIRVSRVE